jgi:hypothetical protein
MRPSLLIYILVGVPIFASYQILNQPRFPNLPSDQFDGSRLSKSDPPPIYKDESRSQDGDVVPADLNTEESTAKDEARLDNPLRINPLGLLKTKHSQTATYSLLIDPLLRKTQSKTSHILLITPILKCRPRPNQRTRFSSR